MYRLIDSLQELYKSKYNQDLSLSILRELQVKISVNNYSQIDTMKTSNDDPIKEKVRLSLPVKTKINAGHNQFLSWCRI